MTTTGFEPRLLELKNRFIRSLPDRIEVIAESLRQRQAGRSEFEETLERQFHNLAGTAGTFGFFAIAAVASDGLDGCGDLNGGPIEGDARYLWSIVEELEDQVAHLTGRDADGVETLQSGGLPLPTTGTDVTRTTAPNETRAGDDFTVACHQCAAKFDAAAASWCRCEGRLRTLICPHCSTCFCSAAPRYKKTFWEKAPRSLRENTNRFRIGDGPVAGGGREDVVAAARATPQVLVVDDEEDMRSLVACYVEQMGYAVTTAAGPSEALEILASGIRFEVVITDALMPGMDGRDLCQKVKAEYGGAIKVIVMTSLYTANRYRAEARFRFGVDEYLAKPLHFSVLKAALDRVCPLLRPAA